MKQILSAAILLASASFLRADPVLFTVQLDSVTSGTYNYSVSVAPYLGPGQIELLFRPEQGITLSGLSGVTGASVTGDLDELIAGVTFSDTSAFFFENDPDAGRAIDIANSSNPTILGELHVTSTSTVEGTVSYDLLTYLDYSGSVAGPVAAPEPGTASLLGLSLLIGAGCYARSRRLRSA